MVYFITTLYNFDPLISLNLKELYMATNSLPAAIKIYKGLSIYRVDGSMNWYVRIWDSKKKKYLVKSTGCDNAVQAREVAQELGLSLLRNAPQVENNHTFKHFALKMLNKSTLEVQRGDKSKGYNHSLKFSGNCPA